jgi:hypothetical protein
MRRLLIGVGVLLLSLAGCQKAEEPVGTRPAPPGAAPRPFRPGHSKGEWEDPRLRELRQTGPRR